MLPGLLPRPLHRPRSAPACARELLGLRGWRVDLALRRIEVVEVRYDAGRFGSGYKDWPKSDANVRTVPMAEPDADAMARRLEGCGLDELVFRPGVADRRPAWGTPRLSVGNYRRVYRLARPGSSCPTWTRTELNG